jgi:hypothetical protein
LGDGAPVKESDTPLFENSIFLEEVTSFDFIKVLLLILAVAQKEF